MLYQPTPILEPPSDADWHACRDRYERLDVIEDARDWCATAELSDEQEATIAEWYRESSAYRDAIDDMLAGER